jgi:hypothetical protein
MHTIFTVKDLLRTNLSVQNNG